MEITSFSCNKALSTIRTPFTSTPVELLLSDILGTHEDEIYKNIEESEDKSYVKIVVEPLEKGFGITVGNCLRRTLLSALPGAAAQGIKFAPELGRADSNVLLKQLPSVKPKLFSRGEITTFA